MIQSNSSSPITGTPTGEAGNPTGTTTWTPEGGDSENPAEKETGVGGNPGNPVPVGIPHATPVPVDNPFALILLALGLLGLSSRFARKRQQAA